MALLDYGQGGGGDLMAQIQSLMGGGGLTEDERRSQKAQALFSAAAGLLTNMYRPTGIGLGAGIGAGLLGYNEAGQSMRRDKLAAAENMQKAIQSQTALQSLQDQMAERSTLAEYYKNRGVPGNQPAAAPAPAMAPPPPPPPAPPPVMPTDASTGRAASPASLNMQVAPLTQEQQQYIAALNGGGNQPPQSAPPVQTDPAFSQRKQRSDEMRTIGDAFAAKGLGAKAQQYYDLADKMLPQLKEQKTVTQNGKRVLVNIYNDGTQQVLSGTQPDLEKPHFADTGNMAGVPLDPFTGAPQGGGLPKSMTPDASASNAVANAHLAETIRHNSVTEGDPAMIEQTAHAIATGKQAPLNSYAQRSPIGMQVMGRVMEINPDFNAQDYGTGQKALKDFATGKQGNSVRSFNVALTHLDTLDTLVDALGNSDIQAVNKISNFFSQQTGGPAVTNFNAAKKIVGDEIVKAIVGSGGGVSDREKAEQTLAAANSIPQLKGVIATYKTLMSGQLKGLQQQYETTTKRDDFAKFLSPEAQKYVAGGGAAPTSGPLEKNQTATFKAQQAIKAGKDPTAVKAYLRSQGYSDEGL